MKRPKHPRPASPGRQVFGDHPWRELLRESREGGPATSDEAEGEESA